MISDAACSPAFSVVKPSTICLVKKGSFAVAITRYADGRYYAAVNDGTERQKVTSIDLAHVQAEVERLLVQRINGQTEAAEISAQEARIYFAAERTLKPLGLDVDYAARQVAEAAKILGDPHRILEAARYFAAANPNLQRNITVSAVFGEFIREKETAQLNGDIGELRVTNLREDLAPLVAQLGPRQIAEIAKSDLQEWLNNHRAKNGQPVGARRRRNLRDAMICLWNYARDENYLPREIKTAAEKTTRPKVRRGRQPTFTAAQLQLVLDEAARAPVITTVRGKKIEVDLLPYLGTQAFGGPRGSELRRLKLETAFLWDQKRIRLTGEDADKTGNARSIDMQPALLECLERYRGCTGFLIPPEVDRMDNLISRLCKRVGVKWQRNVLRHSFGTYLTATTYDLGYVSLQMGNDVRTCRQEYLDYASKAEGEAYLGVRLTGGDKVIRMPGAVATKAPR